MTSAGSADAVRAELQDATARPLPEGGPRIVHDDPTGVVYEGLRWQRLKVLTEAVPASWPCLPSPAVGPEALTPIVIVSALDAAGPRPAVILLHSTGRSKDHPSTRARLSELARSGFVAVGVDARYHGERGAALGEDPRGAYYRALEEDFRRGTPGFVYPDVHDVRCVLSVLAARDDVDEARMAVVGVSLGGSTAWLTAAADERVSAVVSMIGVVGFGWALDNGAWQARADALGVGSVERSAVDAAAAKLGRPSVDAAAVWTALGTLAPGLTGPFDAPVTLGLIAPRPVLVLSGADDARCPVASVREAVRVAQQSFVAHDAGGRLHLVVEPDVGHEQTPRMWALCLRFLRRELGSGARRRRGCSFWPRTGGRIQQD